jgi:hypothetical protein
MGIRSWWSAVQLDSRTRLRDVGPVLLYVRDAPEGWSQYFGEVQGGPESVLDVDPCPEAAVLAPEMEEVFRGCARGGVGFRAPAGIPSLNQSMISAKEPERAFQLLLQAGLICVGMVRVLQIHGQPASTSISEARAPAMGDQSASLVFTADFEDACRLQLDTVLVRRGSVVQHYAMVRKAPLAELEQQLPYERFLQFVLAGDRNVEAALARLAS